MSIHVQLLSGRELAVIDFVPDMTVEASPRPDSVSRSFFGAAAVDCILNGIQCNQCSGKPLLYVCISIYIYIYLCIRICI